MFEKFDEKFIEHRLPELRRAFHEDHIRSLQQLLSSYKPDDPLAVQIAMAALLTAVIEYRNSFPIVDSTGQRVRPKLASARRSTATLLKRLKKAQEEFATLPVDAVAAVARAAGEPIGALLQMVDRVVRAVESASQDLQKQPNKSGDVHLDVLALEVALIFRNIMHLKPAATRPTADINGKRGGAAYAHVLVATLALVGREDADLGPVIDSGLALLNDSTLPHNLTE